jgi:hypothetical protein
MDRYTEAMKRLTHRGARSGADALFDRALAATVDRVIDEELAWSARSEREPARRPDAPRRHERQLSGRLATVSAFVSVLLLGAIALWLSGSMPEEAPNSTPFAADDAAEPHIEWSRATVPQGFNVHSIVHVDGHFYGLAIDEIQAPAPRTSLWMSEDGSTWDRIDVDSSRFGLRAGYFRDVTLVGDVLVAIVKGLPLDSDLTDFRLVTSRDGRVWDPVDLGTDDAWPILIAGDESGGIAFVGHVDEQSSYAEVWRSPDGLAWSRIPVNSFPGSRPSSWIAVVDGTFYAVAGRDRDAPDQLVSSRDGIEWTPVPLPALDEGWGNLAYLASGPGGLLLATQNDRSTGLWYRLAGEWAEVTPPTLEPPIGSGGVPPVVPVSDASPVLVYQMGPTTERPGSDADARIWWSTDGVEWNETSGRDAFGAVGRIGAISAGGDRLVVVHSTFDGATAIWTGVVH